MCGIAGFVDTTFSQSAERLKELVSQMTSALAHRGPDDSGTWVDPHVGVAMGHRRLAVIDLSPHGHQPMVSACGRYVIVFNGEIYNFEEIRGELTRAGGAPAWRGQSDTEVLLAAIGHWGLQATLSHLVGMFAMAIWDRQERTLHLVRDRIGEKPLYYGWVGSNLLFGSELKALCAHPAWVGELDRGALTLFLRHNYIPAPYSIFRGISKLPAGTSLTIPLRLNGAGMRAVEPKVYWSVRDAVYAGISDAFPGDEHEAVDHLDGLLRRIVRGQMVADVPVGVFLSGGLDSSSVVAMMQAESSRPVKTFTIGFREQGYDEAAHAEKVARYLGTEHTEFCVSPADAMTVIPRLPSIYDEPFADASQLPTFLVCELARKHVTVSLSGDGGDELFGGYNRYFWGRSIWRAIGWMPQAVRRSAATALHGVGQRRWEGALTQLLKLLPRSLQISNPGDRIQKLAEVLAVEDPDAMYRRLISHWKQPASIVIGGDEPFSALSDREHLIPLDFTHRMMFLDTVSYLPDDILVKVDRAAMAVSLETRIPMLDHRLVEFAWRLPLSMKIRGRQGKWLLRQVLYRYVPKSLVERPKSGFGVPIGDWLRGPLRDWAESLLGEQRLQREGFFRPAPIRQKWAEHLSGRRNWQYYLWDVLMFQAWLEKWGGISACRHRMAHAAGYGG